MDPFHGYQNFTRAPSLRTFNEYREEEASVHRGASVSREGFLLEYETLELRVHPPKIDVDNESHGTATVLTVESANRPGTLVEVVQHLTEMGLEIATARISSDGGWFVDVFHVTENSGKVRCEEKIRNMKEMLAVTFSGEAPAGSNEAAVTVFELVGQDRAGLLYEVTQLMTSNGLDVRSAAVWTYRNRAALVISVTEAGTAMKSSTKLQRLHEMLIKMMRGDGQQRPIVAIKIVSGTVHHDRRLHQRMLEEDMLEWSKEHGPVGNNGGSGGSGSPLGPAASPTASETSCGEHLTWQPMSSSPFPEHDSKPPVYTGPGDTRLRSAKHSKPKIDVSYVKQMGYWLVAITCKDRNKLLFDTVCTLADLSYSVYHAAIDSDNGVAFQEFYVRPGSGISNWDQAKADQMKAMLEVSVQRRFPQGLKLHVASADRVGLLASLSRVLFENQLSIRRAAVKTHSQTCTTVHSFYVMDISGGPPDRQKVEQACQTIGGKLVEGGDHTDIKVGSGDHKFSFSFLNRQWQKEWSGGYSPGSAVSSAGSS